MPLLPSILSRSLQADWLEPEGGDHPGDVAASARALAGAIADWFAGAMAAGVPCTTAAARKGQLQAMLIPALQAGAASAAGQGVAMAFMAYAAGQSFGPGVASPPAATGAAAAALGAAFADLQAPLATRADRIAGAIHLAAVSSIVTFPPPMAPAPVT